MADFKALEADVVAIANGNRADTERTQSVLKLTFPLIPGPNAKVQTAYGAYSESDKKLRPTIVILDREGSIAWRYRGKSDQDRPEVGELLKVLREVK